MPDFAACNPAHQVLVTAQRGSACILIKSPGNEAVKVHGLARELAERSRQKASLLHFFLPFFPFKCGPGSDPRQQRLNMSEVVGFSRNLMGRLLLEAHLWSLGFLEDFFT